MSGPPRFFALLVTPSGALLAGTCGRGAARFDGTSWEPVLDGTIHDFAVVDGALLASTDNGLRRSSDDGRTWQPAGLEGVTVYGIGWPSVGTHGRGIATWCDGEWHFDVDGMTVYRVLGELAATEDRGIWRRSDGEWKPAALDGRSVLSLLDGLAGTRGDGVHSSVDGVTWSPTGLPGEIVHTLVRSPDGSVLAGTGSGVHRSDDAGTTWRPLGTELANRRIFSIAAGDDALLAGSYDGVWRWSGDDFRRVDTGLTPGEAFTVAVGPDGTAFAGTSDGCIVSTDAGGSWKEVSGVEPTVHAVCFEPELFGTADGVWTRDGIRRGLEGRWVFSLLAVGDGRLLAATLGAGVFAFDGSQWQPSGEGLDAGLVYDLLLTKEGTVLAATGAVVDGDKTGAIYRSTDAGRTWHRADAPPMTVYRLVEDSTGRLFAGAQRCVILCSGDDGRTWTERRAVDDDVKMFCVGIGASDTLFLGAGATLLRSDDGAKTWTAVSSDDLDGVTVYDLTEHPAGVLLAATSAGMFRSDDGGGRWAAADVVS